MYDGRYVLALKAMPEQDRKCALETWDIRTYTDDHAAIEVRTPSGISLDALAALKEAYKNAYVVVTFDGGFPLIEIFDAENGLDTPAGPMEHWVMGYDSAYDSDPGVERHMVWGTYTGDGQAKAALEAAKADAGIDGVYMRSCSPDPYSEYAALESLTLRLYEE